VLLLSPLAAALLAGTLAWPCWADSADGLCLTAPCPGAGPVCPERVGPPGLSARASPPISGPMPQGTTNADRLVLFSIVHIPSVCTHLTCRGKVGIGSGGLWGTADAWQLTSFSSSRNSTPTFIFSALRRGNLGTMVGAPMAGVVPFHRP